MPEYSYGISKADAQGVLDYLLEATATCPRQLGVEVLGRMGGEFQG
jgi:hypothetical protein